MATKNFDLIVIGTGVAGSIAAYKCRSAKWNVAIIDSQPFGGTCALRGCDPKKVLVGAAELVDWNNRMKGRGVSGDAILDWPALIRFKRAFTDSVPEEREKGFKEEGIMAFHGRTRFVDCTSVSLEQDILKAPYIVIAAGAKPVTLNIPGEKYVTTSTQFLELDTLPKKIIFVGGGYIAFEFAHIAARAGAHVHIINRGEPLKGFDPGLVNDLVNATREIGIDVLNDALVKSIEKSSAGLTVQASTQEGEQNINADLVVHAAGRTPDIDDMDLEKGGTRREAKGVTVNQHLLSISNPAIYAAGDASASGLPLTSSAAIEGDIVSRNLREGNKYKPDYRGMATVVYSMPPLASVGLGIKAARDKGLDFDVKQGDTSGWYNSRRVGASHSGYKVLIEKGTERILGAHLLGQDADETINLFAMAIRFGRKASEIKDIPFAYPTRSYDIGYML